MSGFMRQLKQNNNAKYNSYKYKKPVKFNQGSVISLQSTLTKANPQKCCADCKPIINRPNHPRSLNKLDDSCCKINCGSCGNCGEERNYKLRNLSNRNLIHKRIETRGRCCKKNINKQYLSNDDLIDQITSENLKRNTLVKPLDTDDPCYQNSDNGNCYSRYQSDAINNPSPICGCNIPRTLDQSLRQYKRCDYVKNINSLDSSEYIALYRSGLVSKNNTNIDYYACNGNPAEC